MTVAPRFTARGTGPGLQAFSGALLHPRRRPRLDALLASLPTMVFDDAAADQYRTIIEAAGFSKRKITDRMIAAQALARDATLVTLNGRDFQEIPNLKLLAW